LVAGRVAGLGAGLTIRTEDVGEESVRALAWKLLDDARFLEAASTLRAAQRDAGGFHRAADELELYLKATGSVDQTRVDPSAGG
jgi:UDP:flavonoid glycosyltransferase YjiC (YdhE family)